jgi:acyl carrier protein
MKTKIEKNLITIDSLKYKIPVSLVDYIDYSIVSKVGKFIIDTGEVIEDTAKNELKSFKVSDTISIRLGIQQQHNLQTNELIDYLVIYVNSKLLGTSYLQGIHRGNIASIYDLIHKMGIVKMPYEVFCIAECSDIDFKLDEFYTIDEWIKILDEVEARVPLSNSQKDGVFRYNKSKFNDLNIGLELGKRDTSTYSRPYIKFYYKEGELLSKSQAFAKENLNPEDYKNLCRIEATLKNKRHAQELGIDSMRLIDLIMLDHETKLKIFTYAFQKHFKIRSKVVKLETISEEQSEDKKLGMKDRMLLTFVQYMVQENKFSKAEIIEFLNSNVGNDTRIEKHKRKKLIDELFDVYLMPLPAIKMNETVNNFFARFGV